MFFQGERILKLAEMCRKLETEAEKVLPFYASSLSPEEDNDVAAAMQEAPSEQLAEVKIQLFVCSAETILFSGVWLKSHKTRW